MDLSDLAKAKGIEFASECVLAYSQMAEADSHSRGLSEVSVESRGSNKSALPALNLFANFRLSDNPSPVVRS